MSGKRFQQLETAKQLWAEGAYGDAAAIFKKLLAKPDCSTEAAYSLGLIYLQLGRDADSVPLLKRASLARPNSASVWNNLGLALQGVRDFDAAKNAFDKAMHLEPTYLNARFNRARVYFAAGNPQAALIDVDAVLAQEQSSLDAILLKAKALHALQRSDEAIQLLEPLARGPLQSEVVSELASLYQAHGKYDLGIALCEGAISQGLLTGEIVCLAAVLKIAAGREDGARDFLHKILQKQPQLSRPRVLLAKGEMGQQRFSAAIDLLADQYLDQTSKAEALFVRASCWAELGEHAAAASDFLASYDIDQSVEALKMYGVALSKSKFFDQAAEVFEQVMELGLQDSIICSNYASCLMELGRSEEALIWTDKAIERDPQNALALLNKGAILMSLGEFNQAIACNLRSVELNKDLAQARFNASLCYLIKKDFLKGWRDYRYRAQSDDFASDAFKRVPEIADTLSWLDGRDQIAGQKVLLLSEQGIGDVIMFSGMLPDLLKDAHTVGLAIEDRMMELMKLSFPDISCHAIDETLLSVARTQYDCVLLIGSLGPLYRNSLSSFPRRPYLKADDLKSAAWKAHFHAPGKRRIGISWRGGVRKIFKSARSLPISFFTSILQRSDLVPICIQHGDVRAELAEFEAQTGIHVHYIEPEEIKNIDDLAALIASLDHVVTVQNTNVHICGALGIACSAVLPRVPEWRYGSEGHEMYWYPPSVRLFRREDDTSDPLLIEKISSLI